MPVYKFTAIVDIEVKAENYAQAKKLTKLVRTVGDRVGSKKLPKNRDFIKYEIFTKIGDPVLVRTDPKPDYRQCLHKNTQEYRWEWDDGYGKQKWMTGLKCIECGAKNSWPGMSKNWWPDV
jgi:hypothetical protein